MHRELLLSLWPWFAMLVGTVGGMLLLVRCSGAQLRLPRLRRLHDDEQGGVQSLSFVLTLPLFMMCLAFILQISQVLIGTIVVHYAAFAAARSAIVWIPATLGPGNEQEDCIGVRALLGEVDGGLQYEIRPGGRKYRQIQFAAALACAPICPSRETALAREHGHPASAALQRAYAGLAPGAATNPRVPMRLDNKLAYSLANTQVRITFVHPNEEPPFARYLILDDIQEFYPNEVGWQDPITVTVTHQFALLPGPGRLLAKRAPTATSADRLSARIGQSSDVFVYAITASATLSNEGEKSVLPYRQQIPDRGQRLAPLDEVAEVPRGQ